MPFKSKAQQRQCYALKAQGKAGTWDCDEWAKETKNFKKLPEKVKKVKKESKKESKMEAAEKFVNFLNDIKTPDTKYIVEGIQKAFAVCFESYPTQIDGPDKYEDGSTDITGHDTRGGNGASAMNEDAESDADKLKNIEERKKVLAEEEELTNKQIELNEKKDLTNIAAAQIKEEEGKDAIDQADIN